MKQKQVQFGPILPMIDFQADGLALLVSAELTLTHFSGDLLCPTQPCC